MSKNETSVMMRNKPIGRKMTGYIGLAAAACVSAIAIAQTGTTPEPKDAAWHNRQQLALAQLSPADGWQVKPGNLHWRRVAGDGVGAKPSVEDTVTVHYAGTFVDGETFDSSYDRGEPATFPLGRLIPAWQIAIPEMAVGDKIEIVAPADLAYGPVGREPIPGGATLKFTVELLGIEGK